MNTRNEKKMVKDFKRKRVTGISVAGIVLMTLLSGCENMSEADMASLSLAGLGMNAETPQQAQSAALLSQFAATSGRRQHELNVARESKTEVNVNTVTQGQNAYGSRINSASISTIEPKSYFFSCNYAKDFNKDGRLWYPDDFVGIKTKFRKNERIIIVGCFITDSVIGKKVKREIYNPKGEEILQENPFTLPYAPVSIGAADSPDYENHDTMGWLLERGGLGTYRAVWYLDGELVGQLEFEIAE